MKESVSLQAENDQLRKRLAEVEEEIAQMKAPPDVSSLIPDEGDDDKDDDDKDDDDEDKPKRSRKKKT